METALPATALLAAGLQPLLRRWVQAELRHWLGSDQPIERRPMLIAVASGLLGLLMALTLQEGLGAPPLEFGQSLALAFWSASLCTVARIDLQVRLIPDRLTALLAGVGLLMSLIGLGVPLGEALAGGVIGYGLPYAIGRLMAPRGRRRSTHSHAINPDADSSAAETGIGRGDLALMAAMGTWVGFSGLSLVLVISACLMLPVMAWGMVRRGWSSRRLLPFGPALAAAGLLVLPWSWLESSLWLP